MGLRSRRWGGDVWTPNKRTLEPDKQDRASGVAFPTAPAVRSVRTPPPAPHTRATAAARSPWRWVRRSAYQLTVSGNAFVSSKLLIEPALIVLIDGFRRHCPPTFSSH